MVEGLQRTPRNKSFEDRVNIPGEPEVFKQLLLANTPRQVRDICEETFTTRRIDMDADLVKTLGVLEEQIVPDWPISGQSKLPSFLSEYASEFIAAKKHSRFPKSTRPRTRLKQLWFLSRALAGAAYGVKTRTTLNLIGSLRPEQMFQQSREGKLGKKISKDEMKKVNKC